MKLETKLGGSTGILVGAILLSAVTAHLRIRESNLLSQTITGVRIPLILDLREVRSHADLSIRAIESYMLFGVDPAAARGFRQQRGREINLAEDSLALLVQAGPHLNGDGDAVRLHSIQEQVAQLKELEEKAERLNESRTPQGSAEAYDIIQKDILGVEKSLSQLLQELSDAEVAQANAETAALHSQGHGTLIVLWLTTLIGALVAGFTSYSLGRRIANGIDLIAARANAIAAGDLTGRDLDLHTDDQIGTLAAAVQQMQANLAIIIGTVVETSGTLIGSAASMRGASDQIHRRIDQQSQQTQQAATAMQEMSASIAEVSRHTQSAAETARAAAQTAREGGTIVKQMLVNMQSIASAVTQTSGTVGQLGEDSKRISQIVTVIDEIARKTNLLALNAAIEAARAGDQGRGFAVVAGEVRRLAESTAQATGEIGTMIHEIQERTRSAIASMDGGTGTVKLGVLTTNQAGEALERIIGLAERVDRMITQIAIAASQQATAADQSSASLDSIHGLSNENLAAMSATAAGIDSLRGTALTLELQVDRFHLGVPADSSGLASRSGRPAPLPA